jgi:hypothetical protein
MPHLPKGRAEMKLSIKRSEKPESALDPELDDPNVPHFFQEALPGSDVCRLCKGLKKNRIHDKVETGSRWG